MIFYDSIKHKFLKHTNKKKFFLFVNICFLNILFYIIINFRNIKKENKYIIYKQIKLDYENNKFAIIRDKCKCCGLFAFYKHFLGCLVTFINKGYIPIIDLSSFPNNINGFKINSINNNPWEYFFNQPYDYSLENVIKKAKNIEYFKCEYSISFPKINSYLNNIIIDFWHNIAIKYIPIKFKIIKKAEITFKRLFKGSKNILGILARGTDYISFKPSKHPIPPKTIIMIKDIKEMEIKNKYDWFFLATEDDLIRLKFIKEFGNKLKYLIKYKYIKYNYKKKKLLCYNKNISGNYEYIEIYLINIIILSKCMDFISARTSGAMGTFILSNGFRNIKIYFLGNYK